MALWISPNVEHYEYLPENEGARNPWPRTPYPDVQQYSYRDYGNRVGFWRMLEPLDKYGIKCCVSLNMAVLEHFPEIGEAMVQRDYDYMSHGIYNTRYLYTYDEDREREFYRDTIDTLRRHTGKQLKGMLGPAISGSVRTPDLMAEAGLIYHTDWMHDDQPGAHQGRQRQAGVGALLHRAERLVSAEGQPLRRRLLRPHLQGPVRPALPGGRRERPGSCASPCIPSSSASPTASSTWTTSWATSCLTMGFGRPPPTRLPSITSPTITTRRLPIPPLQEIERMSRGTVWICASRE